MNFSLFQTTMILNNHRVEGWSEDEDALMMPDITLGTTVRGGDGLMLTQSTGDLGGEVTIKLLAHSKSCQFFMQQHELIRRGAQVIWNGSIDYGAIGARVVLRAGSMLTGPSGQTLGKGRAQTRQFVIDFQEIAKNYDGGLFSSPPALEPASLPTLSGSAPF